MTEEEKKQITRQARQAAVELLAVAGLQKGDVFVVGCSSSEIVGGQIGHDSSLEAAQAVYEGIAPVLAERGVWLASQCCEHLNRALILEREAARAYGKANAWLYPTLGVLSHFLYLDFEELRLTPWLDPNAPAPAARVSFRVSARALFVLIAAVQVLIRFYPVEVLDVFL